MNSDNNIHAEIVRYEVRAIEAAEAGKADEAAYFAAGAADLVAQAGEFDLLAIIAAG